MENTNYTNETEYAGSSKQSSYTKGNLLIAFLMGIVIGAGGYYLVGNSDSLKLTRKKDADTEKEAKQDVIKKGDNGSGANVVVVDKKVSLGSSVVVNNQPAGLRVVIDSVTLDSSGWVAIHEDIEGELGNILGAQRFDAGTYKGLVDLLRNTVEGGVYYAVLYTDDGDSMFDHKKDALMANESGEAIKSKFNAVRIR